jgi:hypothetical protein
MTPRNPRSFVAAALAVVLFMALGSAVLGGDGNAWVALPLVHGIPEATPTVTPTPGDDLAQIVAAGGTQPSPPPERDQVTPAGTAEAGDYRYAYEVHDVVDNIQDLTYLGLNDDVLWPGNLIRGAGVPQFVYDPIMVPRAPLTISLSVEGAGCATELSTQVANPALSTMRQAISTLVGGVMSDCGQLPAQIEWKYEQMFSQSQMSLFAQADLSYVGLDLNSRFDWQDQTRKTKIMASFRQILYSVDIDTPASPAALFAPSVTPAQLAAAIPPGSMPMYLSGVKYGMMAFMFVESAYSAEEIKVALDVAYSSGDLDASGKFGYTHRQILDSSKIEILVYGGSIAGLESRELNGLSGFLQVIQANIDAGPANPGVPLVYKFKHLHNNTLAYVTLTSQYTLVRPIQVKQRVMLTAERFVVYDCDDEGPDNTIEIDRLRVLAAGYNHNLSTSGDDFVDLASCPLAWADANGRWYNVYWREWSDWLSMCDGSPGTLSIGSSCILTFLTAYPYDWSQARLRLLTWARDWDTSNSDSENAYGDNTFTGDAMLGPKSLWLGCDDFWAFFDVNVAPLYTAPNPPPAPASLGSAGSF